MKPFVPVAALCVLASSSLTHRAGADWPQQRHDAQRTALANGSSNVSLPAPYFRYYLGGSLGQTSLITHDVDGDGTDDIIYSSGGSVHAKRSNDSTIWKTPPMGLGAIAGIADLNDDGADDLVLYARGRSVILELSSGAVQWLEPDSEMGTLSGIAIGDLNGDDVPDLLVQECGCCGVNSGNSGYVYSFAAGFGSPQLLWQLPYAVCGSTRSLTLVDADGTPPLEVMNNTNSAFNIVAGASGAVLASTASLGSWIGSHFCRSHDVDGQPGEEILCVQNVDTQPATNQRRITVLKYGAGTLSERGRICWSPPTRAVTSTGSIPSSISTPTAVSRSSSPPKTLPMSGAPASSMPPAAPSSPPSLARSWSAPPPSRSPPARCC